MFLTGHCWFQRMAGKCILWDLDELSNEVMGKKVSCGILILKFKSADNILKFK